MNIAGLLCLFSSIQYYANAATIQKRQAGEQDAIQVDATNWMQRIVGGRPTSPGSWPWLVWLGGCGGSLISRDWVVTASHCIKSTTTRGNARAGSRYANTGGEVCGIRQAIRHPKYGSSVEMSYDVALVQLDCSLSFTNDLSPIALPRPSDNLQNSDSTTVYIAGWGLTSEDDFSTSSTAREAELTSVSLRQCRRTYGSQLDSTMMCAYGSGVDTCQGDSGGPLVVHDSARDGFVLHGVTSFGYGCARSGIPGVYHHVPASVDWIKRTANIDDSGNSNAPSPTSGTPGGSTGGSTSPSGCDFKASTSSNPIPYKLFNVGKDKLLSNVIYFESAGSALYYIRNMNDNRAITLSASERTGDGERAVWSDVDGSAKQKFSFVSSNGDECHIKASHSQSYLDMGSGTGACGPSVCQWTPDGSPTQQWRFYSQTSNNNRDAAESATSKCGISMSDTKVKYNLYNKGKERSFAFGVTLSTDGTVYEMNDPQGRTFTSTTGGLENGDQFSFQSVGDDKNQKFTVLEESDGYCYIVMQSSGKYFDVGDGIGACGVSVCLWDKDGSQTQLWKFERAS